MSFKKIQRSMMVLASAGCTLLLVGCPPVNQTSTKTVPVTPMCTLQAVIFESNPKVDSVLEAERTDPTVDHGFGAFHPMNKPVGNPAVGFTTDVYGINEAWLRNTAAVQIFRAQATPAPRRGASSGFDGSAWSVETQDHTGTWSVPFAGGSTNHGETDDPATGGSGVAQLMPVGSANPEMFACAGDRTMDDQDTTTSLFELMAPNASKQAPGSQTFIQDMLNGDDHFVPNAPGPGLHGPANPPSPTVSGPGDPIRNGAVQCAMLQTGDDVTTRELHMLAVHNGTLYHSVASNFGPVNSGTFFTFNRFRTVSHWEDVGQVLGGNFGNVISAAIVASRPNAISVIFLAGSNGRYRLWHAVRFSPSGSWRPPDDVMRLSGDAPSGTVYPYQVSAGACPAMGASDWTPQNTDLLIALWGTGAPNPSGVTIIRVLNSPVQFSPTVTGIYSPLRNLLLPSGSDDAARNATVANIVISGRPFKDNALPPP